MAKDNKVNESIAHSRALEALGYVMSGSDSDFRRICQDYGVVPYFPLNGGFARKTSRTLDEDTGE